MLSGWSTAVAADETEGKPQNDTPFVLQEDDD